MSKKEIIVKFAVTSRKTDQIIIWEWKHIALAPHMQVATRGERGKQKLGGNFRGKTGGSYEDMRGWSYMGF